MLKDHQKAYIIGTFDTKSAELLYLSDLLSKCGIESCLVDVSTSPNYTPDDRVSIQPSQIAQYFPKQSQNSFDSDDRGAAIAKMKESLIHFIKQAKDIGGVIGAGGSGNTDLVSAALRELPVGLPKIMVSTVGSGNIAPYVGPNDIAMVYSVTDVAGLNTISRKVLGNAAHALAGMMNHNIPVNKTNAPALGLTMFGVTTPCVDMLRKKFGELMTV